MDYNISYSDRLYLHNYVLKVICIDFPNHSRISIHIQAESNPRVKELIALHVPVLEDFVLMILKVLKETIDKVPFGIRWLCKATWSLVHEKFPDTQPETLNALIGGFFFLRYINPIIATPHG